MAGESLQAELHGYLADRGLRYVDPGFVCRHRACPLRLHDHRLRRGPRPFYDSSVTLVRDTLVAAWTLMAEDGCRRVAAPALARATATWPRRTLAARSVLLRLGVAQTLRREAIEVAGARPWIGTP